MKTDDQAIPSDAEPKASDPIQPLQQTRVDVRIHDLVARYELEHRFRNGGDEPLEALLTFPMPPDAAFLGLQAEFDGKQLKAEVIASRRAEEAYDEAVAEGDAAILVRTPEPGILTLSLGNLMLGESATVRLQFACRVPVADASAWFRLPTVLRPRYGLWHLDDFETPEHDLATEHPLSVSLEIQGLLHGSAISCPSHAIRFEAGKDATRITIPSAFLDRDVVLQFDLQSAPAPSLSLVRQGDQLLASLTGPVPATVGSPGPMDLCLVLDGSGSMVGDAIMQSREAVRSIARLLGDGDRLQVLRFGSSLQPMFRRLMPCKAAVRQALGELAGTLEANLGGTEMQPALLRALRDLGPRQDGRTRAIVLVTDGAVQPSDIAGAQAELVEAVVRVFVVAVGSSAGVEVLAPLAHKTGAAIERAILGESIDAAAERMARRARHPAPATIHLSWPGADAQVLPHAPVYPGDAFELAVVAAKVPTDTVTVEVAGARHALGAVEPVENDALRALLGQARYRAAARDDRASIALAHGLLTDDTAAVLVHKRTDDTRAKTLPQTIKIPSMIPAGMAVRCVSPIAMMACPPDAAVSAADVINGGLDACIMDPVDLAAPMFSRRPATAFDLSGVPALVEAIAPTLRSLLTQARSDVPTLEDLLARLAPELASQARAYFDHLRLHLHDSATFVGVLSAIVDGLGLALSDEEEIALALAMTRYNDPEQILPGAFDAD